MRCCNPRREQLATIGFDEVEKYLFRQFAVARRSRCQKKQRVFLADGVRLLDFAEKFSSIFELRFELSPHFWADGVAATVNSRAYGDHEIAGRRAEPAMHFAHAFLDDTFDGAAPARPRRHQASEPA